MKQWFALLLSLAVLGACTQERSNEEPQPAPEVPTAPTGGNTGESGAITRDPGKIALSLEGETDEGDLRALRFHFRNNSPVPNADMVPGTIVPVLCILRTNQPGDLPTVLKLDFVATGTNTLAYNKDPNGSVPEVTINDYSKFVKDPTGTRRWYLKAIIGGTFEQVGGVYTGKTTIAKPSQMPAVNINAGHHAVLDLPYVSQWVEIEPRNNENPSKERFGGALSSLVFKPQGSVLCFAPDTQIYIPHVIQSIKVNTASFDVSGSYNVTSASYGDEFAFTPSQPAGSTWSETFACSGGAYVMPAGKGSNGWHLVLWVMPRATQHIGSGQGVNGLHIDVNISSGTPPTPATTFPNDRSAKGLTKTIQHGKVYRVPFTLVRPKMAIEHMAKENVSHTPGQFAPGYWTGYTGLYRWGDIAGAIPTGWDWRLPSRQDWESVFHIGSNINIVGVSTAGGRGNVSETVRIGNTVGTYTADYRWTAQLSPTDRRGYTYALRYKGGDNHLLSAWRYEVFDGPMGNPLGPGGPNNAIRVRVRYLGPTFTGDINTIANEGWWSGGVWGNYAEKVRDIASTGYLSDTRPINDNSQNGWFYYWFDGSGGAAYIGVHPYIQRTWSQWDGPNPRAAIRPFSVFGYDITQ